MEVQRNLQEVGIMGEDILLKKKLGTHQGFQEKQS